MSSFTISGQICEKESKKPIAGLFVCPISQDEQLDGEMVIAITDRDGKFRMVYRKSSAAKLFEKQPDVRLSIYAPPWRFLLDTVGGIPWGKRGEEKVEIKIPKKLLGHFSPSLPGKMIEAGLDFHDRALRLVKRGRWSVPRLPGFQDGGPVGAPALPRQYQTIALPRRAKNLKLVIKPGRAVRIPVGRNPMPIQPPQFDLQEDDLKRLPREITALYPHYIETNKPFPEKLVMLGSTTMRQFAQLVRVAVQPVQYDAAKNNYVFYPRLRYTISYDLPAAKKTPPVTVERLQLMQKKFDDLGAMPGYDLGSETIGWGQIPATPLTSLYKCVIITSNKAWPDSIPNPEDDTAWPENIVFPGSGKIKPPTIQDGVELPNSNTAGGPVEQFQRLAKWKTQRGVRTKVVTIEEILGGTSGVGDCVQSARDLQEVIRNFIKKAETAWNFEYLLIGGSIRIVPMRYLLGYATCEGKFPAWDNSEAPVYTEQPEVDYFVVEPSAQNPRRVRLCHNSETTFPNINNLLCNASGLAISYKSTPGTNEAGWYFANENFSAAVTESVWKAQEHLNIIVEGPDEVVDINYHWAFPTRFVPSDLYYACLETNSAQLHDWDLNNNRIYGQFRWDGTAEVTIDSQLQNIPDISVGRAPIDTAEEARDFVDKVLTYEKLCYMEGDKEEPVDPAYLKRIVVAGDVHWKSLHLATQSRNWSDSTGVVPEPGTFTHIPNEEKVLVHLDADLFAKFKEAGGARRNLLARFHQPDGTGIDIPIPYQTQAPGWYFVDASGKCTTEVSEFLKAKGDFFATKPWKLLWRYGETAKHDSGTQECEDLVSDSLLPSFPEFNEVSRYYTEFLNFTDTDNGLPRPLDLNPAAIRAQLDLGCHFLVLRGHGSYNGVSKVLWHDGAGSRADFRNHHHYFIAYAVSCSTARPDYGEDLNEDGDISDLGEPIRSLGETIVLQKDGGAIAYVGYPRLGISAGFRQAQIFWQKLKKEGQLGPAAAATRDGDIELADMWQYYNQVLYGDPEMPVWTANPRNYDVVYPDFVDLTNDVLAVYVLHANQPLRYQRVTISAWVEGLPEPILWKSKVTNSSGLVIFDLEDVPHDIAQITLAVAPAFPHRADNFKPFIVTIPAGETQSGWKHCVNCQTLFYRYSSNGNPPNTADCFCGGAHVPAEDETYRLRANTPCATGQQNWRYCKKCRSLFYDSGIGVCPEGGEHDSSSSGEYVLDYEISDDDEHSHWRYCQKCHILFCDSISDTGKCQDGNDHTRAGKAYIVPIA